MDEKEPTSEGGMLPLAVPACLLPFILTATSPLPFKQSPVLSGTWGQGTGQLFNFRLRPYTTEEKTHRLTPNNTQTVQGASKGARGHSRGRPGALPLLEAA